MSFLKQLLKPFVEFDDEGNKNSPAPSNPVKPTAKATAVPAPVPVAHTGPKQPVPPQPATHPLINAPFPKINDDPLPVYAPSGVITEPLPEHQQYFEKLIDQANQMDPYFAGADYKEFVDAKLNIDDIADESLKYKTAYDVLKNSGLTKEKLMLTGQEYLNIIGRDLNAFQAAHSQQAKKELGAKEALVQKKAEELLALTVRINALKSEINQLTQEINLKKEKLDTTRNSFLLAGENKQNEIQRELEKIAGYFSHDQNQ